MRFHKVTEITQPEVNSILDSAWTSLNPYPVMNLFDAWFDIRRMTHAEVEAFTHDWMRGIVADVAAGSVRPH